MRVLTTWVAALVLAGCIGMDSTSGTESDIVVAPPNAKRGGGGGGGSGSKADAAGAADAGGGAEAPSKMPAEGGGGGAWADEDTVQMKYAKNTQGSVWR